MNLSSQTTPGSLKSIIKGVLMGLTLLDTYQAYPIKDISFVGSLPDLNPLATLHRMDALTPQELQRLRELQDLDILNEALDPDPNDQVWKCIAITQHKVWTMNLMDIHTKVKAIWADGDESWVRLDALKLQDPYPLVKYGVKKKLPSSPTGHG
jgi:hypothetical protein